jgi:hypothetical protein
VQVLKVASFYSREFRAVCLADKNPNFKKIKNGQSFNYEPGFLIKRRLVDIKV